MQNTSDQVRIVLAVWGEKFIQDFLKLSLASLLAPGNTPALSKQYPTRFVFLTRKNDIPVFESEPAFQILKTHCEVAFITINDLIIVGNYSTTLTLAYDRAVRQTGQEMLNTYFIFLTADYIMADGSFEGLMRYMAKGYSGIQAGNFQVIQEEIESYVTAQIDPVTHVMAIKPRELLKKSLPHLHPITVASLVDQDLLHNYRANRFFCRDGDIMAGRFYLLHMLCIKPETMDYQIGASCDYSFIPEMCPSGNIATITDSDDYLVVEIQPQQHELDNIELGACQIKKMGQALSEWTTRQHRLNANDTIFFHTNDLSAPVASIASTKLTGFIDNINLVLNQFKPKSYHKHPYWLVSDSLSQSASEIDVSAYDTNPLRCISRQKKYFQYLFGAPPRVYPWHYRWYEYHSVTRHIQKLLKNTPVTTVEVFYDSTSLEFMAYASWLKQKFDITHQYDIQELSRTNLQSTDQDALKTIIIFLTIPGIAHLFNHLKSMQGLRNSLPNINVILINTQPTTSLDDHLKQILPTYLCDTFNNEYKISQMIAIRDYGALLGLSVLNKIDKRYAFNRKIRMLLYVITGAIAAPFYFIKNCLFRPFSQSSGHCTNILITISPTLHHEYSQ